MYEIHDTAYFLIPLSTVLLEKLMGFQLVNKFPTFYGTRMFITTFKSLHDTTANVNENRTVHHKAAIELLFVLNKKASEPLS